MSMANYCTAEIFPLFDMFQVLQLSAFNGTYSQKNEWTIYPLYAVKALQLDFQTQKSLQPTTLGKFILQLVFGTDISNRITKALTFAQGHKTVLHTK